MGYKIGSFNVRNLSWGAGARRDLDMIADIIREYDIIALQEVLSEGKILEGPSLKDPAGQAVAYEYSLRSRLGENWDMCWLNPETDSKWYPYIGKDSRGEGYAFLWRTDKFECPRNEHKKEIRPRVFRRYKVPEDGLRLIRDPGYGRFQVVNTNTEIRLITTHIVYGKPDEDNLTKAVKYGTYEMREREFEIMAQNIYTRICEDVNDINFNVPYTIILGDYNLNLVESGAGSPYVPPLVVLDGQHNILPNESEGKGHFRIYTVQKDLSTINNDGTDYSSNYDHFTYDDHVGNSIVPGTAHRLNAVEKAGGHKAYKESISDHIPIMLEIDFNSHLLINVNQRHTYKNAD